MKRLLACLFGVLLPLCAFQSNPAAEKPKEEKKGSIEGRVVNSVTGEAVRKATLMLAGTNSGSGARPATTETDDTGSFAFKELNAGKYQLVAQRAGFATQMYGGRGSRLSGTTLSVSAGQTLKDLVFRLTPGAVISGKVLDEEGEPVMSVAVMAMRPMYQRGKRQLGPAGAAQSNDLGEYRIAGLAAGRYILRATYRNLAAAMGAPGSKPVSDKPEMSYVTTYYPGSADADGAAPVEVGTGAEIRGTDIRLVKSKTVRVKGKLIGMPQGKPAVVMLAPKGAGMMGMLTGGMAVAQPPDGAFEFRGIAPGSYMLNATAALDLGSLGASLPVEVGEQHIEGIALVLGESAELPGAVSVEGPSPADPKGAQVMLEPAEMVGRAWRALRWATKANLR